MKILLVTDYGTLAGGAEVIVFGLRDVLRARGHRVRVFSSSAGAGEARQLADDCCFGTTSRWRTLLQSGNVLAMGSLAKVIDRFQPDVVHINLYLTQLSPLILHVLRDLPVIYYAQWYRSICPLGTRRLPGGATCTQSAGLACLQSKCLPAWDWFPLAGQMWLDRRLGSQFTQVTAISKAVAARLADHGQAHASGALVVYPGTKLVEPRSELEMTLQATVMTAGRLVPEKGVDVLIRAFALISSAPQFSARLIVVGEGPSRLYLQRLAEELGLSQSVEFRGHRSHRDTLAEIRRCWCLCVPSVWEEPFGMIAAEAQMNGVAVVASGTGGLAEIVEHDVTGHLVPPGDIDALAARLKAIVSDARAALAMGRRGHQRARALFSLPAFGERFEAVYRHSIAAHRAGRQLGPLRPRPASRA